MTDQLAEDVRELQKLIELGHCPDFAVIPRILAALSSSQARERVLREAVDRVADFDCVGGGSDVCDELCATCVARTALARVWGMK